MNITKKFMLMVALMLMSGIVCAQTKKVAVLEPICRDGSVNLFYKNIVRGEMEIVVASLKEYQAYDRTAFDKIMEEQNFQRSGAVSDSDIKKLGVMAGVDYIVVPEVSAFDGYLSVLAKILDVETGQYNKAENEIIEMAPPTVKEVCGSMAQQLFNNVGIASGPSTVIPRQSQKVELQLEDGRYVGEVSNGKPHGKGIIYYKSDDEVNRVSYEGDWVDGIRTGNGVMIWKNGARLEGGWKNGKSSGYGIENYANGDRYEGNYENGKRFGQGTYYWVNGNKYVGNWNSKINGFGIKYFANGDRYEGQWIDDCYNGQGTYYWANGDKYDGNWENDKRNGFGTEYFSGKWEGDRREGYWKNGMKHGKSTYYWSDGDIDYENWVEGKKEGEFTRIKTDGRKLKAKYHDGEMVEDWH